MPDGDSVMSDARRASLIDQAQGVLERNRREAWTCPSRVLYPHQWLWDSCFTAIGVARDDPTRAADELRAPFRGQWDNGMLPHMIFAAGSRDLGNRTIWRSRERPGAPRDVDTTCITQPPLVAIAAWRVAHLSKPMIASMWEQRSSKQPLSCSMIPQSSTAGQDRSIGVC